MANEQMFRFHSTRLVSSKEQLADGVCLIRQYCYVTNCADCEFVKRGMTGCEDKIKDFDPLNDPVYVTRCVEILHDIGFNGDDEAANIILRLNEVRK